MSDAMTLEQASGRTAGAKQRFKKRATNLGIDLFLSVFGLLMILPLILLVANAFKTPQEMLSWPPTVIP